MNRRTALLVRWSAASAVFVAASGAAAWLLLREEVRPVVAGDPNVEGRTDRQARARPADLPVLRFRDGAAAAGLVRAPFRGVRTRVIAEDMGTGVGIADFDGDGDLDLLFAGSGPVGTGGPCLLYRNEGGLRFTDVSAAALPQVSMVGMAVAVGDPDGDGDPDALVTAYGGLLYLRNRGDGTFEDAGAAAGLRADGFCAGASFGDLDGDGREDLYVTRYVRFVDEPGLRERTTGQYGLRIPAALNPSSFPAESNLCFRNRGDGTFEEVAEAWGIHNPAGRSLGAAVADLDGDGRPEIYVANDVSDNALFRNAGGGRFEDVSHTSCTADYRGAMGLAVTDIDGDRWPDLFVTHWLAQENGLYRNGTGWAREGEERRLFFTDDAEARGLGFSALDFVGWGAVFTDLDGDGRDDLWVSNGDTFEREDDRTRLRPQAPLVYWNAGPDRGFHEVARECGPDVQVPRAARGLAAGDLDGDGDEDLVATVHGEPPVLWINDTPTTARRLTVRLRSPRGATAWRGAVVSVTAKGRTQVRWAGVSPSYLSSSAPDLVFGLGTAERAVVEVRFPGGGTVRREDVPAGSLMVEAP